MTYQFKIQIKGITKPPVWRKIAISADSTFLQFHYAIQNAFGWYNCHLFEFEEKGHRCDLRIAIPSDDDDIFVARTMDATTLQLKNIYSNSKAKFLYVYDYGDYWEHEITLISTTEAMLMDAVCLSGKGTCPPEDCGGVIGYEKMKNVFHTNPNGQVADEYRDWLGLEAGEVWDANHFLIDQKEKEKE
ncbi:MAG: plasmid pRiA4b ORF-3 family protein [Bacteroides sp.]